MDKKIVNLMNDIMYPSKEFTPIPFWFLNDEADKEKIRLQLLDFVQKGVNAIVIHPRIGIPDHIEYLSDAYFEIIKFIVKTASELDMKIVLYDEAMYPSGSAHGEVVKANPEFASVGIIITDDPKQGKVITDLVDGRYIVQKYSNGTIRGIHFGEDDKEEKAPLSANILNPSAVDQFIELTHEKYYENMKDYFGNTIIGFFTDEPCVLGRNSSDFFEWTGNLEQDIVACGGEIKELAVLFDGGENKTTKIYQKLIKRRLMEVFYSKISKWCEDHGIALMGHPAKSDDIDEEMYFHIPGQDLIFRQVSPEEGGIMQSDSVQAKCTSDMARHLGKKRNSNECFGVCSRDSIPWYFTGEDMKWYIDWLGVRGVNLFVPHAFYYSIEGERKSERPPDVGPNNIWWDYYKYFSDYMKRVSFIMSEAKNCAKVAVLCESNHVPYKEVAYLYENQIEFNYSPVSLLDKCTVKDKKLYINGYEYDTILNVNGNYNMDFIKSIQTITDGKEIKNCDLITEKPCKDLRVTHLMKDGIDMYFLFNEGSEEINTKVTVPKKETPIFMDLWNANDYKVDKNFIEGKTQFSLQLKRYETLLLLLGENSEIKEKPEEIFLDDISSKFKLISCENNKKTYSTVYRTDEVKGNEAFEVVAEEMVECYCNGEFVGVSFWNKHRFYIGELLQKGENEIKLLVTGNIANIYSKKEISYGIGISNDGKI